MGLRLSPTTTVAADRAGHPRAPHTWRPFLPHSSPLTAHTQRLKARSCLVLRCAISSVPTNSAVIFSAVRSTACASHLRLVSLLLRLVRLLVSLSARLRDMLVVWSMQC